MTAVPPIKPGTAHRLGLHSVLNLRPGVVVTGWHLNDLNRQPVKPHDRPKSR